MSINCFVREKYSDKQTVKGIKVIIEIQVAHKNNGMQPKKKQQYPTIKVYES